VLTNVASIAMIRNVIWHMALNLRILESSVVDELLAKFLSLIISEKDA
jgi:hypothetical protein